MSGSGNNKNYINLENVPILIEEVDSSEMNVQELSQFVETNTITIDEANASGSIYIDNDEYEDTEPEEYDKDDTGPQKSEGAWINKLINGEGTYLDYHAPLKFEDLEDDDSMDVVEEKYEIMQNFDREVSQSRKDSLKGNIQGNKSNTSSSTEKSKRKRRFLPPALQGLMGQANLCYARGEIKLAEKVCLEIIREVPLAPEPFLTLAQIYETKDIDKFLQFSLIAAHLNPSEVDQWIRIAEISVDQGNIRQAISCYNKAIKADPKNINLRIKRIELLESIGEYKYAQRCYFSMLNVIPKEQSDFLLETAKTCAKKYHADGNYTNAMESMNRAYSTASDSFNTEDINLYLELLILGKSYTKALDIICQHTDIEVKTCDGTNTITSVVIPLNLLLDFRTKLVVILIHLHSLHLMEYLVNDIFTNINVEDDGDCYLDIAEALMAEKEYRIALKFLSPLVSSKNFNLAAVWLRYADSNRAVDNIDEAIRSYLMVVSMAPTHSEAKLTLAALFKKKSCLDEALQALDQNPEKDIMDPELLYEKCLMLQEMGRYDEFIESGYLLITRHSYRLRSRLEMAAVLSTNRFTLRINSLRDIRETRCEPLEDVNCPEFIQSPEWNVTVENEWLLFNDLLKCSYNIERYDLFQKLAFTAMSSRKFQAYNKELDFIVVLSCIYNRDPVFGYNLVREYISKDINNPRVWNLFNLAIMITDDIRYIRFLVRLFDRIKDAPTLPHALEANYYLSSGTYKYALNDYISAYKKTKEPLLAMLASVTLTQIASQKYSSNKLSLISQAIAFMDEYTKLREKDAIQEIHYNFGRMYHQLNLVSAAIDHYKKALQVKNKLIHANAEHLDLKREIAFNLHLIYKNSGNFDLARKYLFDYIEV